MTEIRDILERHGTLNRFVIHLAPRHFELQPDEVLIERPDPDGRTQHVTLGSRAEKPNAIPTTWLLQPGPEMRLGRSVERICVPMEGSIGYAGHN